MRLSTALRPLGLATIAWSTVIISAVSFAPPAHASDTVTITDAAFARCLADKLGVSTSKNSFPKNELAQLTSLNCSVSGEAGTDPDPIGSLDGAQYLTGLTDLTLIGNQIQDLAPLNELGELTHLVLTDNRITSVAPLSGLTKLTHLSLASNAVTDVTPLAGMTELNTLWLRDNQLASVAPLEGLTKLATLDLSSNSLSSTAGLAGLSKLTELDLHENVLTDISALSGLTGLAKLLLADNQLTDISALRELTKLRRLELGTNRIVDLAALSGLTDLAELGLYRNQINDLSSLAGLAGLTQLDLGRNQVLDVTPLSSLTGLTQLDLSRNRIVTVAPLATLSQLKHLWLNGNPALDLSALSSLSAAIWAQDLTPTAEVTAGVETQLPLLGLDGQVPAWLILPGGMTHSGTTFLAAKAGKYVVRFISSDRQLAGRLTVTAKAATVPTTSGPKPALRGTAKVRKTLQVTPGRWQPSGVTLSYQWYRDDAPIKKATAAKYRLRAADAGAEIRVNVTGTKQGRQSTTVASKVKKVAWMGKIKAATPKVSGSAKVGATLRAKLGKVKPSGTTATYQWYLDGQYRIDGATSSTYRLTKSDVRYMDAVSVRVTLTKTGYPQWSRISKGVTIIK